MRRMQTLTIVALTVDEIKVLDGNSGMYAVTVWHRNGIGGHVPMPGALGCNLRRLPPLRL